MDGKGHPKVSDYDSNIRIRIPGYDGMLDSAVYSVRQTGKKVVRWLDVGCGTGNMATVAKKSFPGTEFVLLDISQDMLSVARSKLGADVQYVCASSDIMPFEDCSFDVVTCIQSNHYYDEAGHARALSECFRVLRDGGLIVVTENKGYADEVEHAEARAALKKYLVKGLSEDEAEEFLNRYGVKYHPHTPDEHKQLLSEAGFSDPVEFWVSYSQTGMFAVKTHL